MNNVDQIMKEADKDPYKVMNAMMQIINEKDEELKNLKSYLKRAGDLIKQVDPPSMGWVYATKDLIKAMDKVLNE